MSDGLKPIRWWHLDYWFHAYAADPAYGSPLHPLPPDPDDPVRVAVLKARRGCDHEDCLGPQVAANRGGCRMATWADVG